MGTEREMYEWNRPGLWERCTKEYGLSDDMCLKLTLALGIDPDPVIKVMDDDPELGNDDRYWGAVYDFLHELGLTAYTDYRAWQYAPIDRYVDSPERLDLWRLLSLSKWQNDRRVDCD